MSDLTIDGMVVNSSVVETIAAIALSDVEGIGGTGAGKGLLAFLGGKDNSSSIEVSADEEGKLLLGVHVAVKNGYVLPDVAAKIRAAIADALETQVGATIAAIDVYVDSIVFEN